MPVLAAATLAKSSRDLRREVLKRCIGPVKLVEHLFADDGHVLAHELVDFRRTAPVEVRAKEPLGVGNARPGVRGGAEGYSTARGYAFTMSAMKTKSSVPAELSTPWPEPDGVQVESPGPILRFAPLSS